MIKKEKLLLAVLMTISFNGCEMKMAEEAVESDITGKWLLAKSYNPADSIFLGNGWLELKQDKSFNSNSSFFWRNDSLRNMPLIGSWSVSIIEIPTGGRQGIGSQSIVLQADLKKGWALSYNSAQMYWSDTNGVRYTWNLQK
jgi:hypothetical protein